MLLSPRQAPRTKDLSPALVELLLNTRSSLLLWPADRQSDGSQMAPTRANPVVVAGDDEEDEEATALEFAALRPPNGRTRVVRGGALHASHGPTPRGSFAGVFRKDSAAAAAEAEAAAAGALVLAAASANVVVPPSPTAPSAAASASASAATASAAAVGGQAGLLPPLRRVVSAADEGAAASAAAAISTAPGCVGRSNTIGAAPPGMGAGMDGAHQVEVAAARALAEVDAEQQLPRQQLVMMRMSRPGGPEGAQQQQPQKLAGEQAQQQVVGDGEAGEEASAAAELQQLLSRSSSGRRISVSAGSPLAPGRLLPPLGASPGRPFEPIRVAFGRTLPRGGEGFGILPAPVTAATSGAEGTASPRLTQLHLGSRGSSSSGQWLPSLKGRPPSGLQQQSNSSSARGVVPEVEPAVASSPRVVRAAA